MKVIGRGRGSNFILEASETEVAHLINQTHINGSFRGYPVYSTVNIGDELDVNKLFSRCENVNSFLNRYDKNLRTYATMLDLIISEIDSAKCNINEDENENK